MVRAGVSAANVERTIASIDDELGAVLDQRLHRGQEIDDAKQYLTGSLPRQLETNAGIAGVPAARPSCTGWASTTTAGCRDCIQAVSYDDVARAAARLLDPARAVVAVAGPWTDAPA